MKYIGCGGQRDEAANVKYKYYHVLNQTLNKPRNIQMIRVFIYIIFICVSAYGNTSNNSITLPWQHIAEYYSSNQSFCIANKNNSGVENYAINLDTPFLVFTVNGMIREDAAKYQAIFARWQQDKFIESFKEKIQYDPNGLRVGIGDIADGFYSLSVKHNINDEEEKTVYLVVSQDWRKDLLSWCQAYKQQIEMNPDDQLINSSIAASHFDNLMEVVSQAQALSGKILFSITSAVKAIDDYENGKCPNFSVGLNKIRLRRFSGASIAELILSIPEDIDPKHKYPVIVFPDPRRVWAKRQYKVDVDSDEEKMIRLWWHFPKYLGYEWKDYLHLMSFLDSRVNIDKDRIYINGSCGNGIPAIDMALKHPDIWAECNVSLGNASRQLAGNAINLPLIFVKGGHDQKDLVAYYDFAVECFKYHNCRYFKHSKSDGAVQLRVGSLTDNIRDLSPCRVFYTIESLADPDAYWLRIDGREDENYAACVDAMVWGQCIYIKTRNVDAYTLNLQLAPLDCSRPVEIIEEGERLDCVSGEIFRKKSSKYENALYIKSNLLHGPVVDAFTDPYVVLWNGDENLQRFGQSLAGSGPCFADNELPDEYIKTHNIIYVGRIDTSHHFAQVADKLPVDVEGGCLKANGRSYEGDYGAIFIYPNPLNSKKYLVVMSGATEKACQFLNRSWGELKNYDNADVGIFLVTESNKIEWLICEKFNTVWNWHESWDIPLANLDSTYPKWKWCQWVAHILKMQMHADIMISEDPFISDDVPYAGVMTMRDVARLLKNDWLVKISVKGSDLRELLTVPFNDIKSRKVSAPVIDGASLIKQPNVYDVICISELDNDRIYTVAMPYKAVNGTRMGMVIKNYRLEGEDYLVPLVRDYLRDNQPNLDKELSRMQLNIF